MFLSHVDVSLPLPLSLKINKILKKKKTAIFTLHLIQRERIRELLNEVFVVFF